MTESCVFLEREDIGGINEHTYYAYYCRKLDLYNEDILCEDCEKKNVK